MTFVGSHYPRELMNHLREQHGAVIEKPCKGIYHVQGLMFPVQVILAGQLPASEYTWLSRMRADLNRQDILSLAEAYKGKGRNPTYEAVMDLIVRANGEQYKGGKRDV